MVQIRSGFSIWFIDMLPDVCAFQERDAWEEPSEPTESQLQPVKREGVDPVGHTDTSPGLSLCTRRRNCFVKKQEKTIDFVIKS